MSYTVHKLAILAGVSARTLHYYDSIGLLKPATISKNGYRNYKEKQLLILQQIMFFRELDFPLLEIKKIITSKGFDINQALLSQKKLIELKKLRLNKLIKTIDKTIKKINLEINMEDKALYDAFEDDDAKEYIEEAKERWGNTEAYKESQKRVAKMTKAEMEKVKKDGIELTRKIGENMNKGFDSLEVQALISEHYNALRSFYEPNLEMYKGLAEMYVADPRFAAYYEKFAKGLAKFMHDAMIYFVENKK